MPRPFLSESASKWPWWCCGPAAKKTRRIARKVEKRQWIKEEMNEDAEPGR